jgi:hypothetical protein
MKPVDRSEILPLADYERVRPHFRARVIEEKERRRAKLGDRMSVVFENHDTVLLQIQEMLRTERITTAASVDHEIATYNELVPGEDELSMTLFIEARDREEREALLTGLAGMERCLRLVVDGEAVAARAEARDGGRDDRTTAVQYYKIPLTPALARKLRERCADKVSLVVDHPGYRAEAELAAPVKAELASDLS